jgi:hypothetical protein
VECQTWRVASELGEVRGAIVSPRLSSGALVVEYGETLESQRRSESESKETKKISTVLPRLSSRLFLIVSLLLRLFS